MQSTVSGYKGEEDLLDEYVQEKVQEPSLLKITFPLEDIMSKRRDPYKRRHKKRRPISGAAKSSMDIKAGCAETVTVEAVIQPQEDPNEESEDVDTVPVNETGQESDPSKGTFPPANVMVKWRDPYKRIYRKRRPISGAAKSSMDLKAGCAHTFTVKAVIQPQEDPNEESEDVDTVPVNETGQESDPSKGTFPPANVMDKMRDPYKRIYRKRRPISGAAKSSMDLKAGCAHTFTVKAVIQPQKDSKVEVQELKDVEIIPVTQLGQDEESEVAWYQQVNGNADEKFVEFNGLAITNGDYNKMLSKYNEPLDNAVMDLILKLSTLDNELSVYACSIPITMTDKLLLQNATAEEKHPFQSQVTQFYQKLRNQTNPRLMFIPIRRGNEFYMITAIEDFKEGNKLVFFHPRFHSGSLENIDDIKYIMDRVDKEMKTLSKDIDVRWEKQSIFDPGKSWIPNFPNVTDSGMLVIARVHDYLYPKYITNNYKDVIKYMDRPRFRNWLAHMINILRDSKSK